MTRIGRKAIFRDKTVRVQGLISHAGSQRFEAARRRLGSLADWPAEDISDADVVEYLARGHDASKRYIARMAKEGSL